MPISSTQEFEEWLESQTPQMLSIIAGRSAVRVFPLAAMGKKPEPPSDLSAEHVALFSARDALISVVAATSNALEISLSAARSSFSAANTRAEQNAARYAAQAAFVGNTSNAAYNAANAAFVACDIKNTSFSSYNAIDAPYNANRNPDTADAYYNADETRDAAHAASNTYNAIFADCDLDLDALFDTPIWHNRTEPEWLQRVSPASERLFNQEEEWFFWRDWYQGFLDGKPLDWELQRRVALIPDEDWEKGPEHIARIIEEVRARFELEKRVEALEAEKQVWEERDRLGVGGNNPPEPLEDDRIIQKVIWAPIDDLKSETQSGTPDKSRIRNAISKLGAALIAIGKWPLGKLDKAADEFAKSLGKWGGGVCAAWLAKQSGLITKIIEAAQHWLGTLL